MPAVLLVAVADEIASALRDGLSTTDMEAVASAGESRSRIDRAVAKIGAVVLGPGLSAPIQVAQHIYTADPDLGILLLYDGDGARDLETAVQIAPLLGVGVRCVPLVPRERLGGELREALEGTQARRAHRRTIAALNERLTASLPDLPRTRADEYVGQLLEHAPIGIIVLDARGRVVAWNPQVESLTGLSERKMLGAPLAPLFTEDERPRWEAFCHVVPRPGGPLRETFRMRGAAGLVDVDITLAGVSGGDGGTGMLVLLQDVTAREQAWREREAAVAQLALLAEASRILSASLDVATTLEIVARLAVPRLGDWCLIDLLEPGGWFERVAVAHTDPSKSGLASRMRRRYALAPGGAESGGAAALGRGEPLVVTEVTDELLVQLARDDDGFALLRELQIRSFVSVPMMARGRIVGALGFLATTAWRAYGEVDVALARDLADRAAIAVENARLYAAAQEARRQAEEASRFKDEFLAIVSHELRTPLTAMLGWAHTLSNRPHTPEVLARGLASISRSAAVQARIVEDVLDMSRIITGKLGLELRPMDLVGVARDALEVLSVTAKAKAVTIELFTAAPVFVLGDADRLQQVVWNLLTNAIKFTPTGGRIELHVGGDERSAEIVVRDTGAGIDPDFLPYVFDRFRQADASATRLHGGLGLGLAIVRHLVELHGGAVRVESGGPARGATFTVTLPRLREEPAAEPAPPPLRRIGPAPSPRSLEGTKVLIVEDDPDTRELLVMTLREQGADVSAAGSAAEALAALGGPLPDIVVSDLAMPDEDGIAFLRRMRRLPGAVARIPALALSALASPSDRCRALLAGYQRYLAKPVNIGVLTTAIAELASKRAV